MENRTVIRLAKKYNLKYEVVQMQAGATAYLFKFNSIEEYSAFTPIFSRCKNLYVDSNVYAYSFFVWDVTEHKKARITTECKMHLVNMFYEIMHNGGTPEQGKQAQIDYCTKHPEYLSAFNLIYSY